MVVIEWLNRLADQDKQNVPSDPIFRLGTRSVDIIDKEVEVAVPEPEVRTLPSLHGNKSANLR